MPIQPSNLTTEQRAMVERGYYRYLRQLAQASDHRRFDPQGRWIVTVRLTQDNYDDILRNIIPRECQDGDYDGDSKSWLRETLRLSDDDFSDTTLCSIDCQSANQSKNDFLHWLYPQYSSHGAADQRPIDHRLDVFWKAKDRGSVIRLQEELESHQSLVLRGLERYFTRMFSDYNDPNVLGDYLRKTHLDVDDAIPDSISCVRVAMQRELNNKMREVVRQALEASVNGKHFSVESMNKLLNDARVSLTKSVYVDAMAKIIKEFKSRRGPLFCEETFKRHFKYSHPELTEAQFESTSATGHAYLSISHQKQALTWMSPARKTAHDKQLGDVHHAARLIKEYSLDNGKDPIIERNNEKVFVRVPSLAAIMKGRRHDPDVQLSGDIREKLNDIRQRFFHDHDQPIIYNLLTSLNNWDGGNDQVKSARLIMQGAHRYNVDHRENTHEFVFVQNLGINQYTPKLEYGSRNLEGFRSYKYHVVNEALLLSEMSLIQTLSSCFPALVSLGACKRSMLVEYQAYLRDDSRAPRFYQSEQGRNVIEIISNFREAVDPLAINRFASENLSRAVIAKSLLQIFKIGAHKDPKYGMLTQSLSVYLQKYTLTGCKSANERFTAVKSRESALQALVNRNSFDFPYSKEEVEVKKAFQAFSESGDLAALSELNSCVSRMMNNCYQSDAMAVSHEDQGAAPKVKVFSRAGEAPGSLDDTNHYESALITSIKNGNAKKLQAHNAHHAQKIKVCIKDLPVKHPSPDIDREHKVADLDIHVASQKQAERLAAVSSLLKTSNPDEAFLDSLYHDILLQEIKYDDDKGVQSFFKKNADGSLTYVRDARGLGSASDLDKTKAQRLTDINCQKQRDLTSRQWLVMGINYTLALATLLHVNGKLDEKAKLRLNAMKDKFIEIAEENPDKLRPAPDRCKDHFLNYVRTVLAPELHHHLPEACDSSDANKAIKLLDKTKAWVAMQQPSFHVATVSQIKGDSHVGAAVGEGSIIQYEQPVCTITDTQQAEWNNYQSSTWYRKLSSNDKKLCDHYASKLRSDEGRVIPAQLRNRLGIGARNTYNSETYFNESGEFKKICQHGHSGGLPVILDTEQYESKSRFRRMLSSILKSSWFNSDWGIPAKNRGEYGKIKQQMLDTAKENLEQRFFFAREITGNANVKVLSVFLNTRKAAKWILGDKTDFNITRFTEETTQKHNDAYSFRPGVALGMIERTDMSFLRKIRGETNSLIRRLKHYGLDPSYTTDLQRSLKELNKSSPWLSFLSWPESCFTFGSHTGVTIASKLMVLLNARNHLRSRIISEGDSIHQRPLVDYARNEIDEFYVNVSCASGDNRTQDGSLYTQICALNLHSDIDKSNLTSLLALNGHAHIMAGSQGGSFGTVGIRSQSFGAFPTPKQPGFRKLHQSILSTEESDLKSATYPKVKKGHSKLVDTALRGVTSIILKAANDKYAFSVDDASTASETDSETSSMKSEAGTVISETDLPEIVVKKPHFKDDPVSVTDIDKLDAPEVMSKITKKPQHFSDDTVSVTEIDKLDAPEVILPPSAPSCIQSYTSSSAYTVQAHKIDNASIQTDLDKPIAIHRNSHDKTTKLAYAYKVFNKTNPSQQVDVVTSIKTNHQEVIERITTTSTDGVNMVISMAQQSMTDSIDSGDYFEITGKNFGVKLLIALNAISTGIDVTLPNAAIRWYSLKKDYQLLTEDQRSRVDSTISDALSNAKNSHHQMAIYHLQQSCQSKNIGNNNDHFPPDGGPTIFSRRPQNKAKHLIESTSRHGRNFMNACMAFVLDIGSFLERLLPFF